MDLSHVAARPNLTFQQLDLFDPSAKRTVQAIAAQSAACIAIGTHLCGALSPRLIDIAASVREIDGLVLSPCCLKGALGSQITKQAKRRGVQPYPLAVSTLAELCRRELEVVPPPASVVSETTHAAGSTQSACRLAGSADDGSVASQGGFVPYIDGSPPPAQTAATPAAAAPMPSTAAAAVEAGIRGGPGMRVVFDADVLSPKNAFIVARMASRDPPRTGQLSTQSALGVTSSG